MSEDNKESFDLPGPMAGVQRAKVGHTPGPWKADFSKYRDGVYLVQAEGPSRRVLASFDGDGDGYDPTDIANAHLISAAPDQNAALLALVDRFNRFLASDRNQADAYNILVKGAFADWEAAAEAIAKATGADR